MKSLKLSWDGVLGQGEVFRLYKGAELIRDDLLDNTITLDISTITGEVTFSVTAYHVESGLESDHSNVVIINVKKPQTPTNLVVEWVN